MSLIDIGTPAFIANETTQSLFGTNAWNFFTDGWLGRGASPSTSSSWRFSAYELMTGMLGLDAYAGTTTGAYGVNIASAAASSGMTPAQYAMSRIKVNAKDNAGRLLSTIVLVPVGAKMVKKLLAKPLINPVNRTLKKIGLSQATGVKL